MSAALSLTAQPALTTPAAFMSLYAPRKVPGLITGDARQITTLGKIDKFDSVVADETYLGEALEPDVVHITHAGVMAINNPTDAKALFRNEDPEVLFISTQENFPAAKKSAIRLEALLPKMAVVTFLIFDRRGTDLYADGLRLAADLPHPPYQIQRTARTVASLDPAECWTAWIARIDRVLKPRADPRQADLRPLRLLERGEDPSVLSFADPGVAANQMAFQCGTSWKENALSRIAKFLPEDYTEVPGQNIRGSSQFFPIIPRSCTEALFNEMAAAPEFFLIPIHWWRGQGFSPNGSTRVFDVWVSPDKKLTEVPFIFSTLLRVICPVTEAASVFDSTTFGIQPIASNKWRVLAGAQEIAKIRSVLAALKKDKGLRFRDEETGIYLDEEDPDGVYASGIPPYWQPADICAALGLSVHATKCVRSQFSLGDLRTTSWLLQGDGIDRLAGSIHRSQFDTITVSSSESFKRLRASVLGSRPSRSAQPPGKHATPSSTGGQFGASYVQAVTGHAIPFSSTPVPYIPGPPTSPEGAVEPTTSQESVGVEELMD